MSNPVIGKKKIILFSLVAVILSIILSVFVIGEIIFRLVSPKKPAFTMDIYMGKPDPVFHHSYPPNIKVTEMFAGFPTSFSINNQGFRGKEYSIAKPKGTYRILVLGDSFVFGTAVNDQETFCSLLEEKLNSRVANQKYEVINCGVVSYSPILEYIALKTKLVNYSPDLVILLFNFLDLTEDVMYEKNAIRDKAKEVIACNPFYVNNHPDYILSLRNNFYFFSHIYNKLSKSFQKMRLVGIKNYIGCILQGKSAKKLIVANPTIKSAELDTYFLFRDNVDKKVIQHYWNNSRKWIDKINDILNENGSNFILVTFPLGHQVSKVAWKDGRVACQLKEGKLYDSPVPFEMLQNYSQEKAVNFMNLRPYLLEHSEEPLYYDFDGHWTALGHQRVAEGILSNARFEEIISQERSPN